MNITCEQADEMLAAFAMSRLDREDEAAVTEHLSSCRQHDIELVEFRAVASALPLAADPTRPPEHLRARLMQAFDAQAAPRQAAGQPREKGASWLDWFWRRPQLGYGLAAALLVAVIGLAAWGMTSGSGDNGVTVKTYQQGGMTLRVLYLKDQQVAVVDVDMPALAGDKTYQAWKINDAGTAVSLGLIGDRGAFAFHTDLSDAKAIAISVEPPGGSAQPTTTPVIVEEL